MMHPRLLSIISVFLTVVTLIIGVRLKNWSILPYDFTPIANEQDNPGITPADNKFPNGGISTNNPATNYLIYLPSISKNYCGDISPSAFPLFVNVGGSCYRDAKGNFYYPDMPWSPGSFFGYIGGNVFVKPNQIPLEGYSDEVLYQDQRVGWQEYRFGNISRGDYLLTLYFNEQKSHGPGITIFDVSVEGQKVLSGLDVFAQAGLNYPLVRRFAVKVMDNELNVTAVPVKGEPLLAALAIEQRDPDIIPPAVPDKITALGSYNAILLDWPDTQENDLDGYYLYRSDTPDGHFARITSEPIRMSRFIDVTAMPHSQYYYRASAVDVYQNESALSDAVNAAALDKPDATLPFLQLMVPAENLNWLYANPLTSDEVTGTLSYQGQTYPVLVRFRGTISRYYPKKSWEIIFQEDSPFPGQKRLNLAANFMDSSMLHSKLAFGLYESSFVHSSKAEYVLLSLNGEYMGVYTSIEEVNEDFLKRTGLDPEASIYKVEGHFAQLLSSEAAYRLSYDKKTNKDTGYGDLISFIELINNTPNETFAYQLNNIFDVASYLRYSAVTNVTSNIDFTQHNIYLLHDLKVNRWELVPWDLDLTFYDASLPINAGTFDKPNVVGGPNTLLSRVLDIPQFRAYYCQRLEDLLNGAFSGDVFYPQVDGYHQAIEADGLRDWRKWGREDPSSFMTSPAALKNFSAARKASLQDQIIAYCPKESIYLKVNELMADNKTTLCDPDDPDPEGCYDDWFEIYNAGLEDINLQGLYLTDDPADPTKFQVSAPITVPAQGFALFWADDEPEQGANHTNFKLSKDGETVAIYKTDGRTLLDSFIFGQQTTDISVGHFPDGVNNQRYFSAPTPGSSNRFLPPIISGTLQLPLAPTSTEPVVVSSTITSSSDLEVAVLYYQVNGQAFISQTMTSLGDNLYRAQIPAQLKDSLVKYYILAQDRNGLVSTDPGDAPAHAYQYSVDYQPPLVFINEFMADNKTTLCDPDDPDPEGCYDDWFEIYNAGLEDINLQGLYLTDNPADPAKFQISTPFIVPAQSFVLFWADDETEQGANHTNFKLSKDGEAIAIVDLDGMTLIDQYTFGQQSTDISEGRCPDGSGKWLFFDHPTPGMSNTGCQLYQLFANTPAW